MKRLIYIALFFATFSCKNENEGLMDEIIESIKFNYSNREITERQITYGYLYEYRSKECGLLSESVRKMTTEMDSAFNPVISKKTALAVLPDDLKKFEIEFAKKLNDSLNQKKYKYLFLKEEREYYKYENFHFDSINTVSNEIKALLFYDHLLRYEVKLNNFLRSTDYRIGDRFSKISDYLLQVEKNFKKDVVEIKLRRPREEKIEVEFVKIFTGDILKETINDSIHKILAQRSEADWARDTKNFKKNTVAIIPTNNLKPGNYNILLYINQISPSGYYRREPIFVDISIP